MAFYERAVQPLVRAAAIQARIGDMAAAISQDYAGQEITLIGVMKGALFFLADLAKAIDLPVTIELLGVSSYQGKTYAVQEVSLAYDTAKQLRGRHVILVEDVVDTGLTMQFLLKNLKSRRPASLKGAALLEKPGRTQVAVPIDYKGFTIEDVFVVGYGMDYKEKYRNLPFIGILKAPLPAL